MKYLVFGFFMFLSMSSIALGADEVGGNFLAMAMKYVDLAAQLIMGLSVVATVLVRMIPGSKDDESVDSIVSKIQKYLGYLPTFGINPRTKELEKALENLKKESKEVSEKAEESEGK